VRQAQQDDLSLASAHSALAAIYMAFEGNNEEARRAMDDEVLKFARSHVPSTLEVAEFHALLGDTREALDWLARPNIRPPGNMTALPCGS
jgi:hypothetical protein